MTNVDATTGRPPTSALAIASLTLGLLTVVPALLAILIRSGGTIAALLYFAVVGVPALLAVVFGHVSWAAWKRGERRGYGMASWGTFLGYLALLAPFIAAAVSAYESR